jgi:hypothetical protein
VIDDLLEAARQVLRGAVVVQPRVAEHLAVLRDVVGDDAGSEADRLDQRRMRPPTSLACT